MLRDCAVVSSDYGTHPGNGSKPGRQPQCDYMLPPRTQPEDTDPESRETDIQRRQDCGIPGGAQIRKEGQLSRPAEFRRTRDRQIADERLRWNAFVRIGRGCRACNG